jgi:hypothetical protein
MRRFMLNKVPFIFGVLFLIAIHPAGAQSQDADSTPEKAFSNRVIFKEGFENGMPAGWTQQVISSPDGYNVLWNIRKGAGIVAPPSTKGVPDTAAVGARNLVFQWQGIGHVTRMITPPINLEFVVNPVFTFYHAQAEWVVGEYDRLNIYYRLGKSGQWRFLSSYNHPVNQWADRTISLTDHESDSLYIALEGINGWGSGICIDEFTITETGVVDKKLDNFTTRQLTTDFIPSNSLNNRILRSTLRVTGNSGNLSLKRYTAKSLNTSDNDVSGIKLYYTTDEVFHTNELLGHATAFSNGTVVFENLNRELPTGYSYLWLVYDVAAHAVHGNYADAYIPANGIQVNSDYFPAADQSPTGRRIIYESLFYDDFDTDKGWVLTGEWQRDIPTGAGGLRLNGLDGSVGHPGAAKAYSGTHVLGTDLTGLGTTLGNYEPGIGLLQYTAISPALDLFYYKDITLSFHQWLNVEPEDKIWIHISTNEGQTWEQIWVNNNFVNSMAWNQLIYNLPGAARKSNVKIRFGLGPTDMTKNYSGWDIDNLVVTGTHITRDAGIASWIGPLNSCSMSNQESIVVEVENFGAKPISVPIPLGYSLNGGATWIMDTLKTTIAVGQKVLHTFKPKADFSTPGRYNNIIVKTFWADDQDNTNDAITHKLFSVPTLTPPYTEQFIAGDGLWTGYGQNSSWNWASPSGSEIKTAYAGTKAWFTNAAGPYNALESSWLESPCFNFSSIENPVIEFYLNTHTETGQDGLSIQYTTDEGANWQLLSPLSTSLAWGWIKQDVPVSALNNAFATPYGWHGHSNKWNRVRAVLGAEVSGKSKIKFRLVFASDNNRVSEFDGIGFDAFSLFSAPHDVGVAAVVSPQDNCTLSNQQPVTIAVKNFGLSSIPAGTQIPVGVEVDDYPGVFETLLLSDALNPGQSIHFTFNTSFNLTAIGTHSITAFTMLAGDSDFYLPGIFNDTLSTTITVHGFPTLPATFSDTIFAANPSAITLDAGAGFAAYLWNNGATTRTITPDKPVSAWYKATVTDIYGCKGSDSVLVATYDIAVIEVMLPAEVCELSRQQQVPITLVNNSPDTFIPGFKVPLLLELNSTHISREVMTVQSPWLPGEQRSFTFQATADMQAAGIYAIRASLAMRDVNPANDVLQKSILVHGYPDIYLPPYITTNHPEMIVLEPGAGHHSYLWQDASTLASFNVPTWGQYTVQVSNAFGCTATATTTVYPELMDIALEHIVAPAFTCTGTEQNQVIIRIKNSGYLPIAAGTSLSFTYTINGGTTISESMVLASHLMPFNTRDYTFATAFPTPPLGQNSIVTGVFFDLDEIPGNNTKEQTFSSNSIPELTLGDNIYLQDPRGILLSPGAGFKEYLWNDGSSASAFTITSLNSQTYSVTVTDHSGCSGQAAVKVVTYNLTMDKVVAPVSHCVLGDNEKVSLQVYNEGIDELPAGYTIQLAYEAAGQKTSESFVLTKPWAANSPMTFHFIRGVNMSLYNSYTLEASVLTPNINAATNVLTSVINLTENPKVHLGPDIYTSRPDTIVLNAGAGFVSYRWQDGYQQQIYPVSTTGWKWVTVTDDRGCVGADTLYVGFYTDVARWDEPLQSRIYPNPSNGRVTLELENMPGAAVIVDVLDAGGRRVQQHQVDNNGLLQQRITIDHLSPGIYYITLTGEGILRKTHKLIKL